MFLIGADFVSYRPKFVSSRTKVPGPAPRPLLGAPVRPFVCSSPGPGLKIVTVAHFGEGRHKSEDSSTLWKDKAQKCDPSHGLGGPSLFFIEGNVVSYKPKFVSSRTRVPGPATRPLWGASVRRPFVRSSPALGPKIVTVAHLGRGKRKSEDSSTLGH